MNKLLNSRSMTISENTNNIQQITDDLAIVTLSYRKRKFGASIFANGQLQTQPEDKNNIDRDFLNFLALNYSSIKILTSVESSIAELKHCMPQNATIELVSASDFSLITIEELNERFETALKCSTLDEQPETMKSLNGLLSYLRRNEKTIPQHSSFIEIDSSNVSISKNCMEALQIFSYEPHPSMHSLSSGAKEGCSIFSLFSHTVSDEGKSKLKKWFLSPTNNISVIKYRQAAIELLSKPEMENFMKKCQNSLKKCIQIGNVLNDLKFKPDAHDLERIRRFCDAFHEIHNVATDLEATNSPLLDSLKSTNFIPLFRLSQSIRKTIDPDKCKSLDIYTVKEHINPRLDNLRQRYICLPEYLSDIVKAIARSIDSSSSVEALNIVYFPQLGFLLTLPIPKNGQDPTKLGNELEFDLQFQSEKICYYKNEKMRELDERIGDVYADIMDVQLEILQELVDETIDCESLLKLVLDLCSELDCLIALAIAAQMHSLNKPEMVDDASVLQIENGRHLLVEIYSTGQCIPNDCNLNSSKEKLIITGPNSSGKSVYLKQIGIIVFLAHIGSFIPAQRAKIGLVDRILTRIKTIESCGSGDSSFMIDLKQARAICDSATDKSLILIDEFGKGTGENDGIALFSGLLDYLSGKSVRLIAITHMYEVFRKRLINEVEKFYQFANMKVVFNNTSNSSLCYLFKLQEGIGEGQSFAINCAKDSGLPEQVINNAKALFQDLLNGASAQDLRLNNTSQESLKQAIDLIKQL